MNPKDMVGGVHPILLEQLSIYRQQRRIQQQSRSLHLELA
jgi:hypothetical protein